MTNYEKIKNMTVDEMAEFIYVLIKVCEMNDNCSTCICNDSDMCMSEMMAKKWLEREVEENA